MLKYFCCKLNYPYSKTYFSPQSYNNHYGVPLSLCNIEPKHNFGVFEVGMSNFKEIFKLSSMVKPEIGIITNISEAHLENFKNIQDIAKAKSEIIYNIQKGGTIILNQDDKLVSKLESGTSIWNYYKLTNSLDKMNYQHFLHFSINGEFSTAFLLSPVI